MLKKKQRKEIDLDVHLRRARRSARLVGWIISRACERHRERRTGGESGVRSASRKQTQPLELSLIG